MHVIWMFPVLFAKTGELILWIVATLLGWPQGALVAEALCGFSCLRIQSCQFFYFGVSLITPPYIPTLLKSIKYSKLPVFFSSEELWSIGGADLWCDFWSANWSCRSNAFTRCVENLKPWTFCMFFSGCLFSQKGLFWRHNLGNHQIYILGRSFQFPVSTRHMDRWWFWAWNSESISQLGWLSHASHQDASRP